MSIPPLPEGLPETAATRAANALHSLAIHLLRRARRADAASGLSPERLSVLSVLAYAGPQTVKSLAAAEGVSAPAISRIVSSLESLGLAQRDRAAGDRREVRVKPTAKGRKLMEAGRRRRLAMIAAEFAALSERDLASLGAVARILDRLERAGRQ